MAGGGQCRIEPYIASFGTYGDTHRVATLRTGRHFGTNMANRQHGSVGRDPAGRKFAPVLRLESVSFGLLVEALS